MLVQLLLARHLTKTTMLTHLAFAQAGFSASGLEALSPILKANRDLTHLDIEYNPLQLQGIEQLMEVLPFLIYLRKLCLGDTGLNADSIHYLVEQWRRLKLTILISRYLQTQLLIHPL